MKPELKLYVLFWGPEGKRIGVAHAVDASAARRQAPKPYRKYLGEIGAEVAFRCKCGHLASGADCIACGTPKGT